MEMISYFKVKINDETQKDDFIRFEIYKTMI